MVDESLAAIGGEREKAATLNHDKRNILLNRCAQIVQAVKTGVAPLNNDERETVPFSTPEEENDLYVIENSNIEEEKKKLSQSEVLRVALDGDHRCSCEFRIVKSSQMPSNSSNDGAIHNDEESLQKWAEENLIPVISPSNPQFNAPSVDHYNLELTRFNEIPDNSPIYLSNGTIRSKNDMSELCIMVLQDLKAYRSLTNLIASKIDFYAEKPEFAESVGKFQLSKLEWKELNLKFMNQQIWKRIALAVEKGNHDQGEDFSKLPDEVLPPSWGIAAQGRPKATDEDEDEEAQEDGLCMCCFDGTSSENNRIVFCDGCNAAMHQICYGITEIPEGDYYCDRCKFLQKLSATLDDDIEPAVVKDTVKCCLCPLQHGGIKLTTDGRWVHVCCALWSQDTEIVDLKDMSPINISNVNFTPFPSAAERKRSYSASEGSCAFCNQPGGYLATCSFSGPDKFSLNEGDLFCCQRKFHPLCAWFSGCLIKASILDGSFEGLEREGAYPSGISFCYRCEKHSDSERHNTNLQYQRQLRNKYRMNEIDLEQVPGRNKKKRRKANKPRKSEGGGAGRTGRKTASSTAPKELPPDVYNESICACCLNPLSNDVFGNGYETAKMHELPEFKEDAADLSSSALVPVKSEVSNQTPDAFYKCCKCQLSVHRTCFEEFQKSPPPTDPKAWMCNVCKETDFATTSCILCPRKGGFLCHTVDGTWAHPFCARSVPAQFKITMEKRLDVRVTKENRKQKCSVCNRKGGICLQCNEVGCVNFFHPLCAIRSHRGYVRTRNGNKEGFCHDHIPNGVEFLKSGYWVDGHELYRLRYGLDRSRLVLDMLMKREKLKRTLCKTETDLFSQKITKLIDRAKGRKTHVPITSGGGGEDSDGHRSESDEEQEQDMEDEEDLLDEDDESIDDEIYDEFVPLDYLSERQKQRKGAMAAALDASLASASVSFSSATVKLPPMTEYTMVTGESLPISHTWLKASYALKKTAILPEIKPLKKLSQVQFAGIDIGEKDTFVDGGIKSFQKHYRDMIYSVEDQLRSTTNIFPNRNKEEQFVRELGPFFIQFLKMKDREFKNEMEKLQIPILLEKVKLNRIAAVKSEKNKKNGQLASPSPSKSSKKRRSGALFGKKRKGKSRGPQANENEDEEEIGDEDEEEYNSDEEEEGSDEEEDELPASKKAKTTVSKNGKPTKKKTVTFDVLLKKPTITELTQHFTAFQDIFSSFTSSNASSSARKRTPRSSSALKNNNKEEAVRGFVSYLWNMNSSNKEATTVGQELNLIEYQTFSAETLYQLERVLEDILDCISDYVLPDKENYDILMSLPLEEYFTTIHSRELVFQSEQELLTRNAIEEGTDSTGLLPVVGRGKNKKKGGKPEELPPSLLLPPMTPVKVEKNKGKQTPKTTADQSSKKTNSAKNNNKNNNNDKNLSPQTAKHFKIAPPLLTNGRYLCADFEEVPYELLPDYDDLVRRPISLNLIREKLHDHGYQNLASFTHDFYILLLNARNVTAPGSVTWKDTRFLSKIFEESKKYFLANSFKKLLQQGSHYPYYKKNKNMIEVSPWTAGKKSAGTTASKSKSASAKKEPEVAVVVANNLNTRRRGQPQQPAEFKKEVPETPKSSTTTAVTPGGAVVSTLAEKKETCFSCFYCQNKVKKELFDFVFKFECLINLFIFS
jgi:hypothetical protein